MLRIFFFLAHRFRLHVPAANSRTIVSYGFLSQEFEVGVVIAAFPLVVKLNSSGLFRGAAGRGGEEVNKKKNIKNYIT